jgi:hypothetical protein
VKGLLAFGAVVLVLGYFYLNSGGSVGKKGPSGGNLNGAANQGKNAVRGYWEQLYHQPYFYTLLVAVAAAGLALFVWRRIGPVGKIAVVVIATIFGVITVQGLGR